MADLGNFSDVNVYSNRNFLGKSNCLFQSKPVICNQNDTKNLVLDKEYIKSVDLNIQENNLSTSRYINIFEEDDNGNIKLIDKLFLESGDLSGFKIGNVNKILVLSSDFKFNTKLTQSISDIDTTIFITPEINYINEYGTKKRLMNGNKMSLVNHVLKIGSEEILVTADVDASTGELTVQRGYNSTTATSHLINSDVVKILKDSVSKSKISATLETQLGI